MRAKIDVLRKILNRLRTKIFAPRKMLNGQLTKVNAYRNKDQRAANIDSSTTEDAMILNPEGIQHIKADIFHHIQSYFPEAMLSIHLYNSISYGAPFGV